MIFLLNSLLFLKLILSAKVQAIRDSQIEEKKLIKKELALAEESLDSVMENERIKGILKEREFQDKKKEAAQKYETFKFHNKLNECSVCELESIDRLKNNLDQDYPTKEPHMS